MPFLHIFAHLCSVEVFFLFFFFSFIVPGIRQVAETLLAMARLGLNDSLLVFAVYSHMHQWCRYSIVRWCLERTLLCVSLVVTVL